MTQNLNWRLRIKNPDLGPKICDKVLGFILYTVSACFEQMIFLNGNAYCKLILALFLTFLNKKSKKKSNFKKFTYWSNSIFSFNNFEWCSHYIYSQINDFAEKLSLIKKLKSYFRVPCKWFSGTADLWAQTQALYLCIVV